MDLGLVPLSWLTVWSLSAHAILYSLHSVRRPPPLNMFGIKKSSRIRREVPSEWANRQLQWFIPSDRIHMSSLSDLNSAQPAELSAIRSRGKKQRRDLHAAGDGARRLRSDPHQVPHLPWLSHNLETSKQSSSSPPSSSSKTSLCRHWTLKKMLKRPVCSPAARWPQTVP